MGKGEGQVDVKDRPIKKDFKDYYNGLLVQRKMTTIVIWFVVFNSRVITKPN